MRRPFAPQVVICLVAGCAAVPRPQQVYIYHGPDAVLDGLVAAAAACGHPGVEKAVGNHVEPIVVLTIPRPLTPQYRCTLLWAEDHARDGLTNQPRP